MNQKTVIRKVEVNDGPAARYNVFWGPEDESFTFNAFLSQEDATSLIMGIISTHKSHLVLHRDLHAEAVKILKTAIFVDTTRILK